jgi:hypothetical protein
VGSAQAAIQPHPFPRGVCAEQQTPRAGDAGQAGQGRPASHDGGSAGADTGRTARRDDLHPKGIKAQRLKRVFGIDIETCPACGGAVRIMPKALATLAGQALACIQDAAVIEKILAHFQGKDTSVSTSLRPESRAPPADLFG